MKLWQWLLLAASISLLILDIVATRRRRRPAGNDELPENPHMADPVTERWDASSQGRPPEAWVHPLESESCDLDELVSQVPCAVPGCQQRIRPGGRLYCAIHESVRREIPDGDLPELAAAVDRDVRAFASACRSN